MRSLSKIVAVCVSATVSLTAPVLDAQERGPRHEHGHAHMTLDRRFAHGRYYPARGYVVHALPPGSVSVVFRGGRFYFHGGVWFRVAPGGFVVVAPPVGVVVPVLPPAYSTLWLGGVPYYYANSVFYAAAPSGGYVVVAPPAGVDAARVQGPPPIPGAGPPPPAPPPSPPGVAPPPPPAPPSTATWYYCSSAQAYYPSVQTCPEPWVQIPARPQ
jgi:hypothetical protein